MPYHKYPVISWQDRSGLFNACLAEWTEPSGLGTSRRGAIEDLKQYLTWRLEADWGLESGFASAELTEFKVTVRPEYRRERKRFPLNEQIKLKVHCIHGPLSSGGNLAVLPYLEERFLYYSLNDLPELVKFVVRGKLEGQPPAEILQFVAPTDLEISSITCKVPNEIRTTSHTLFPPILESVADRLSGKAARKLYGQAWQRDDLVGKVLERLEQYQNHNLMLVGESGCGKTTILIEAINSWIRNARHKSGEHTSPPAHRFWQTNAARLIAGMRYLGEWEARLEQVIQSLESISGVLCIEGLGPLIQTGGTEPNSSIGSFCIPYLQRNEMRMVVEATPEELDAARRLLPGFVQMFDILEIPAQDVPKTQSALLQEAKIFASTYSAVIEDDAAIESVNLFQRFLPYRALPGSVSGFFKKLCRDAIRNKVKHIGADYVRRQFTKQLKVADRFVDPNTLIQHEDVLTDLKQTVIGQPDACEAVCQTILRFKAGLSDPQRPLGVLLFCGPTGVGKTELAKALAEYLTPAESQSLSASAATSQILRLDMSEFSTPWSVDRLTHQPDGQPSHLVRKLRLQPFTVVLFDEIEKAHPDVFDVLLNVFDEGRLTDRYGRQTWFRSSVIIMTSNLGATSSKTIGLQSGSTSDSKRHYLTAVKEFFRPEFFNRFDEVVQFTSLSEETIQAITVKHLNSIIKREGFVRSGIDLKWTDNAVNELAKSGFDPLYGARPLLRVIEEKVISQLAKKMLEPNRPNQFVLETDSSKEIVLTPSNG